MKKIIMIGIMLGLVLVSVGGCFIPYYEDDGGHGGHGGHGRDRDDRYEHRR